ncbi:MAG: stage IV sporulation protein A, partial [Clostridia bacterium]|nr:stage IV sporulation protein A [Clostridia bacterium]
MEQYSVYEDVATRTGGDIYVGVVGPVRTGKSTFIKRFMETLVIPSATEESKGMMTDELPQAVAGKTVMTTEPKFVPAKAAKISVSKGAEAFVRLVDCVGFAVEGASGFEEEGQPRLVKTPWQDAPMPFEEAAALGTEKVIKEHSTIGVMVTTDGSITDIPRKGYIAAEERAVKELKALGKPFVILLNCKTPSKQSALKKELEIKYEAPVVAVNVEEMGESEILEILQTVLFEFPVSRIDVKIPKWLQAFPESNSSVSALLSEIKKAAATVTKMRDCFVLETLFDETAKFINPEEIRMELGKGRVEITVGAKEELFFETLSEECGE